MNTDYILRAYALYFQASCSFVYVCKSENRKWLRRTAGLFSDLTKNSKNNSHTHSATFIIGRRWRPTPPLLVPPLTPRKITTAIATSHCHQCVCVVHELLWSVHQPKPGHLMTFLLLSLYIQGTRESKHFHLFTFSGRVREREKVQGKGKAIENSFGLSGKPSPSLLVCVYVCVCMCSKLTILKPKPRH